MRSKCYSIKETTERIQRAIEWDMARATSEKHSVIWYGANDIHPGNLVYWIVVETDREKLRLQADAELMAKLRHLLVLYDYPVEGRGEVHIGFDSHETVDRESGGNFYLHWK